MPAGSGTHALKRRSPDPSAGKGRAGWVRPAGTGHHPVAAQRSALVPGGSSERPRQPGVAVTECIPKPSRAGGHTLVIIAG